MERTILNKNNLPKDSWAESVNTTCYVLNRISMRPILKKTPYELLRLENITFPISKSLDVNALYLTPKIIW